MVCYRMWPNRQPTFAIYVGVASWDVFPLQSHAVYEPDKDQPDMTLVTQGEN